MSGESLAITTAKIELRTPKALQQTTSINRPNFLLYRPLATHRSKRPNIGGKMTSATSHIFSRSAPVYHKMQRTAGGPQTINSHARIPVTNPSRSTSSAIHRAIFLPLNRKRIQPKFVSKLYSTVKRKRLHLAHQLVQRRLPPAG